MLFTHPLTAVLLFVAWVCWCKCTRLLIYRNAVENKCRIFRTVRRTFFHLLAGLATYILKYIFLRLLCYLYSGATLSGKYGTNCQRWKVTNYFYSYYCNWVVCVSNFQVVLRIGNFTLISTFRPQIKCGEKQTLTERKVGRPLLLNIPNIFALNHIRCRIVT